MNRTGLLYAVVLALATGVASADVEDDVKAAIQDFAADDFEVRFEALQTVIVIGGPAAGRLIEALDAEETNVRAYACKALARIAAPEAKAPLQELLESDNRAGVRAAAAEALAAYKDDVLDALRKAASEDPSSYVRKSAVISIASVRTKTAIDQLIWLLKSSGDEIRRIAADGLRDITVEDFGPDYHPWHKWWTDNRADFEMADDAPPPDAVEEEE